MSDIRVRGTTDPDEIAVVLALLYSDGATVPTRSANSAWRVRRRAALARGVCYARQCR